MKAVMYYGKEDLRVEDVDEPQVRTGTVTIPSEQFANFKDTEVWNIGFAAVAICATDFSVLATCSRSHTAARFK